MTIIQCRTEDVRAALRIKYPMPEYCLMEEVRDAAGFDAGRSADAIAMSLWPSRGLLVIGFEIKVSRSDWVKELKSPAKAEAIAKYCDQWYVVAARGIVQDGELPETWGLIEFDGKRLKEKKFAPRNPEPAPLNRTFIAAMMRRAGEIDQAAVRKAVEEQTKEMREKHDKRVQSEIDARTHRFTEINAKLVKIKEQTGVDLLGHYVDEDQIIQAMHFARSTNLMERYGQIMRLEDTLRDAAEQVTRAIDVIAPEVKAQIIKEKAEIESAAEIRKARRKAA